ncbi:SURF1 family protein [Lysobacter niastensis]|uniref:SURF1-like protein n=1 Tax=Lysobacter niastensis TaxID=380629 RepID=A0ABS0BAD9_9GAMM|nr:SURF1 family protein [Lysobacter niastensis]MBF6025248.1 SURF1 family protein [Lysobacter niastensis]
MSRRRNLVVGWTLAVLAIVLFANLGLWQSRRAVEKQAMLDAAAKVMTARTPQALSLAADPSRERGYDWASGSGEFTDSAPLLLDNQQRNGRAGIRVYRIFRPEQGAALLVDLGWLPLAGDRRLPEIPRPAGRVAVQGLLVPPPSAGLAMGPAMGRQGDAWLMTRVDLAAIQREAALAAPLAPRVLRLDPKLPLGYERDLELLPNTLPPDQHRGYALQWFALALAVLATALILTFRKSRRG